MKVFLEGLLPRIVPDGIPFRLIPHEGKSDLEQSIPRKLRAWREPNVRFVVLRDQDSADCVDVKARLKRLCEKGHREDVLIRVVCRELESWYLGDLETVDEVYGSRLASKKNQRKFRSPDLLGSPSQELTKLVPEFQKTAAARLMGPRIGLESSTSTSFRQFLAGLDRVLKERRAGELG